MLLTKLGRPPAPAAANLLRAEGALAPPATGGNGRDRYGRAPPPGKPGAAARWPGGARCPGTAGGRWARRRAGPSGGMAQDCP
jgi:hypothetical protein